MNTPVLLWRPVVCGIALGAAYLLIAAFNTAAADSETPEARQRAETLEKRARQLEADGEPDRARELRKDAQVLRAKAARPGEDRPLKRSETNPRQEEIKRQHERAMQDLKALRGVDNDEQALRLKQEIRDLERRMERFEQPPAGPQRRNREMRRTREDFRNERPAPEVRRRHLQLAIENLHAAGMHELAERLRHQSETIRENLQFRPEPSPRRFPGEELEQLRDEVQQLRQAIRELRAQVEKTTRD